MIRDKILRKRVLQAVADGGIRVVECEFTRQKGPAPSIDAVVANETYAERLVAIRIRGRDLWFHAEEIATLQRVLQLFREGHGRVQRVRVAPPSDQRVDRAWYAPSTHNRMSPREYTPLFKTDYCIPSALAEEIRSRNYGSNEAIRPYRASRHGMQKWRPRNYGR